MLASKNEADHCIGFVVFGGIILTFYGSDFSKRDFDILVEMFVPPNERLAEDKASKNKWFDYRGEHPMLSTYRFADIYRSEYINFYRKYIKSQSKTKCFQHEDFAISESKRLDVWLARQKADILGIPYDFFCKYGIKFSFKLGSRKMPSLSLMITKRILSKISAEFSKYLKTNIIIPTSRRYLNTYYRATKDQIEFQIWLSERMKHAPNLASAISNFCYKKKVLLEKTVEIVFGQSALKQGKDFYEMVKDVG